jgi:GntR family transcriptional regulator
MSGGAHPLQRTGGPVLWQQLLADLLRRLADGEFATTFPSELALVAEYGVSRQTVRQALRQLRTDGVVVAARGRRPRVAPVEIEQPVGALYSLFASVEATGQEQRSIVHTLDIRADGVIAPRLELEESTPLVFLERLRLAGGEPLAVDRVWLPAYLAAPLLDADFTHTALYTEYRHRCGVALTGGRENIRAVVPTPAERLLLGVGPNTAAFAIDRLGLADDQPVEWRHTLIRGDRFGITADFTARVGYRLTLAPRPRPWSSRKDRL